MKIPLYFAHANGFPAPCYRKFLTALQDEYDVGYIDRIGHNEAFPVIDNWATLRDELLADIKHKYTQPVVGVGHSLGGVLIFLAASQVPELFRGVVLLDSPIYGPFKSAVIRMNKWMNRVDSITPAGRTKHRRTSWPDKATALAYFRGKSLFKHFDADCLQDYVDYGLKPCDEGVCLYFDKHIEYHIFRTLPDNLTQYQKHTRPPTLLLYGDDSTLFKPQDLRYMRQQLHFQVHMTKGGHLFPFEQPLYTAQAMKSMMKAW